MVVGATVVDVEVDVVVGAGVVVEVVVGAGEVVVVVVLSGGAGGGASPGAGSLKGTAALDPPIT